MIQQPIHTARRFGKPLRLFASAVGRPTTCWHVAAELVAIGGLRESQTVEGYVADLQRDWEDSIRRVETEEGWAVLAPHWMALGYLAALSQRTHHGKALGDWYVGEQSIAMHAHLLAHVHAADHGRYLRTAMAQDDRDLAWASGGAV